MYISPATAPLPSTLLKNQRVEVATILDNMVASFR